MVLLTFWYQQGSFLFYVINAVQHTSCRNSLPSSYEAARSTIEPYLVQPVVYNVCKNDCILFCNEYSDLVECGEKRNISEDSHTAVRRFTYLPLKPRLERMFGDSNIARILQSHAVQDDQPDCIYDIHQSPAWKSAFQQDGIFKGDLRGISFALCTDGVNQFAHNRVHYSMWPFS